MKIPNPMAVDISAAPSGKSGRNRRADILSISTMERLVIQRGCLGTNRALRGQNCSANATSNSTMMNMAMRIHPPVSTVISRALKRRL